MSTLTDPKGTKFSPQPQNERGAVLIVNGVAYVPFGGHYGDCGTYHGWVIGVPLSGTGAKAWATQVGGAGIWGVGGPASDGQSIFVTTGNGIGGNATWAESEGLFRLDPGPTFTTVAADYFAPYNWQDLDNADVDLSGSGPLVIDAPSMTPTTLLMAQGKDGYLYLINRTDLGGVATSTKLANVKVRCRCRAARSPTAARGRRSAPRRTWSSAPTGGTPAWGAPTGRRAISSP